MHKLDLDFFLAIFSSVLAMLLILQAYLQLTNKYE